MGTQMLTNGVRKALGSRKLVAYPLAFRLVV